MLSIKPVKSVGDAASYYSAGDNYYLSSQGELVDASLWYGRGATSLGLKGIVEPDRFIQLLSGKLPTGQQIGVFDKNGMLQHRPATDITLSAPKSISNMALVGGDERLMQAHLEAVGATMDVIENMAAEARITINGETGFEKTKNLVWATFSHTTSRELDANLHTHCLAMNMTQRSDGLWRSLSSHGKNDKTHPDNGFREIVYENQHYFGLVYTSTLARKVCELGYDIKIKDRYGNFEIVGLSEEYLEQTSKRRNQILDKLNEKGLSSAKAAEKANLDSRRLKEQVNPEDLLAYWKEEANAHGIDFQTLIDKSNSRQKGEIESFEKLEISPNAVMAIDDAVLQLSSFHTQMKHGDLVRMAFMFARGTIHHDELEAEIDKRFNDKRLEGVASRYYTTQEQICQEKSFVKQFKKGLGGGFICETNQSGAVGDILRKQERVQIIDVRGLTHEAELIESLVQTSEAEGFGAYVLHVGRLQSNRLNDAISRDTTSPWKWIKTLFKPDLVQTVAGFQSRYSQTLNKANKKQDVVIVHDAQKLSYQDLMSLNHLTNASESKLILLNNTRSTEGFCAGSPIKALKDSGFKAIQSKTDARRAHFDIIETKNTHGKLAEAFVSLSSSERETTQVVALTNKDMESLNNQIRSKLKVEGLISAQSKEACVLATQNLSENQKQHKKFYDVGDLVTFDAYTKDASYFRVVQKSDEGIEIVNKDGVSRIVSLEAKENFIVTKTKTLDLSVNDSLAVERNIFLGRAGVIERGKTFVVKEINETGVMLEYANSSLYFSNDELRDLSLSHSYVRKPNQLTKDSSQILVALEGYQVNKNVLGELSEYSSRIKLITNDKERASSQLQKESLSFTIHDVAEGKPSHMYRDSALADPVIEKDLAFLTTELSKSNREINPEKIASIAVAFATAKLSQQEAAFEHKTLLSEAMVFAMGKSALPLVEKAIEEKVSSGDLINAGAYWISKGSLIIENNIIENNKNGQNVLPSIATIGQLQSLPNTLTQGQKDAIALAATTRDRFTSVQGLAGTGKTTMMQFLQTVASEKGYKVIGLAPMHTSKDELIKVDIDALTIARFLENDTAYPEKTIFIIDEASMIGNQNYLALQNKIIALNARALFTGDITQIQAQSSGIPHELTIKTQTQKLAFMEEIKRQDSNPQLKKAVIHASNREIKESFETLNTINPEQYVERNTPMPKSSGSVIEVNCFDKETKKMNYEPIYEAIAHDYLNRTSEAQKNTLVIAHAHEDRAHINKLIREGLQKQGKISKDNVPTIRLSQRSMTKSELAVIESYSVGDVLRFDAHYSVAQKGDYLTVTGVNSSTHRLECQSKNGDVFSINPAEISEKSRMSVYRSEKAQLAEGDMIRLRQTNKGRGFVANKEYRVESITENSALLRNSEDYLEIKLDQREDAHWDYSYTITAVGAQSATSTFVLALELSKRQNATTHRSHEIDITRGRAQVSVYTENEDGLVNRLSLLKGDKQSAFLLNVIEEKERQQPKATPLGNVESHQKSADKLGNYTQQPKVSAQDINNELTQNMEALAHHLLGQPASKQSDTLRYGRKGSLSISLKDGLWYNFETAEKGNALQLIKAQMGFSDFKDTMAFAKDFLNYRDDWVVKPNQNTGNPEKRVVKDSLNKRDYAMKLASSSVAIKGTIAEKYLKEHRSLTQYHNAELRFIPKISTKHDDKSKTVAGLLAIARNDKNEINHVQVIRLNPLTGKKDTQSRIIKQTYGSSNGQTIVLNSNASSKITYLTEGIETGLSILECDPNANVQATLSKSNFKNIDLRNISEKIILCLDNDGDRTFKDDLITKSVIRLLDAGKKVSIVVPDKIGADFNDVLREEGAQSVAKQLANPVDAKTLLKSEIQAIKAKDNSVSTLENMNKLRKLNQDTSLGVEVNAKQIAQLKVLDANARKQINRISEAYKHDILTQNQTLAKPPVTRAQKEIER